jgi:hypothetical protein
LKITLIIIAIIAGLLIQACIQSVSPTVNDAFFSKFPDAKRVKWSKEDPTIYEVEFRLNKSEMTANFDEKGTLLETEVEIKESQLPEPVKTALVIDFKEYKIGEISTVEEPGKDLKYEIAVKKKSENLELVFSSDGKLLDKLSEKEAED